MICPDCKYIPPEVVDDGAPGVALTEQWDEVHRGDCPRVTMSPEARARVDAKIESSYRMRGRAAAEAHTVWVG